MCWIQRDRKSQKKSEKKSESRLCWALDHDQVRNLLDCLVFSSHMFLIDPPGYQPCPFLQLFRITVIKWTLLCNCAGSGWGFVSLNAVDMECILVAFKEFGFVLLATRLFWLHTVAFRREKRRRSCCLSMAYVDRKTLILELKPYFRATKEVYLNCQSELLLFTKPLWVCGIGWKCP